MTDDDPERRPSRGASFSSPEQQWLRPFTARAGDVCPACGNEFTGGEPFCGRMCELLDPSVRWEVVILLADLDYNESAVTRWRMHRDGEPFTAEENALAATETRSECAVGYALGAAQSEADAKPWPKPGERDARA